MKEQYLPDPEKVKRTVEMLRESNQMLEVWTHSLDELIAMVEADIRNSPINVYKRAKAERLIMAAK